LPLSCEMFAGSDHGRAGFLTSRRFRDDPDSGPLEGIRQNGSRARRELDQPCRPVPLLLHRYGELERRRVAKLDPIVVARKVWDHRSTGRDATERTVHRCPRLQFGSPKMHEAVSLSMEPPQDLRKITAIRQIEDHRRDRIFFFRGPKGLAWRGLRLRDTSKRRTSPAGFSSFVISQPTTRSNHRS
jgi:hypothetical protein